MEKWSQHVYIMENYTLAKRIIWQSEGKRIIQY